METARVLGMGTLIQGPAGLPMLLEGGAVPANLADNYGALIVPSCGFAQARVGECLQTERLARAAAAAAAAAGACRLKGCRRVACELCLPRCCLQTRVGERSGARSVGASLLPRDVSSRCCLY